MVVEFMVNLFVGVFYLRLAMNMWNYIAQCRPMAELSRSVYYRKLHRG